MAFLRVTEQSMRSLEAMLTMGATANGASPSPAQLAQPAIVQPPAPAAYSATAPTVQARPAPPPSISAPPAPPTKSARSEQLPIVNGQLSTISARLPLTIENSQLTIDNSPDLHAVMMAVVTREDGYPTDMLERRGWRSKPTSASIRSSASRSSLTSARARAEPARIRRRRSWPACAPSARSSTIWTQQLGQKQATAAVQ
jgi:hypothetical protein